MMKCIGIAGRHQTALSRKMPCGAEAFCLENQTASDILKYKASEGF